MFVQRKLRTIVVSITACVLVALASLSIAEEDLATMKETLAFKQESYDAMAQRLTEIDTELKKIQSNKLAYELDIKQHEQNIKKLTIFADKNSSNANELSTAQYKLEVAKIGLGKVQKQESSLQAEQEELNSRVGRITKVIARLERDIEKISASQKAAIVEKKQKQQAAVQQQAAEKARKEQQERERLAELERQKKAEAAAAEAAEEEARQDRQAQLLAMNVGLSAADAAINTARFIGEEPMQGEPALGTAPELKLANPPSSTPKTIGVLKHLGNHQYMADIVLEEGKQNFYVGEHKFFKMIGKNFDGKSAVFIVDARDKEQPLFQLFIR